MPLVFAAPQPFQYATAQDVYAYGVSTNVEQSVIDDRLLLAATIINNYTGTVFGQASPSTYINNDVRKPVVVTPTPFTNVTKVQIDGVDVTQYLVEDYGIRLYRPGYYDADGFPRWQFDLFDGYDWDSSVYGQQVSVTATFGYPDVPPTVKMAAIMLAARYATSNVGGLLPSSQIEALKVEQYQIQLKAGSSSLASTTGDATVDELLAGYQSMKALVG